MRGKIGVSGSKICRFSACLLVACLDNAEYGVRLLSSHVTLWYRSVPDIVFTKFIAWQHILQPTSSPHTLTKAYFTACLAFLPTFSVPGGTLRPPKTSPQTATIPAAPIAYAVSRPAHQYKVQKIKGPRARPTCPMSMLAKDLLSNMKLVKTYQNSCGCPAYSLFRLRSPQTKTNCSVQSQPWRS